MNCKFVESKLIDYLQDYYNGEILFENLKGHFCTLKKEKFVVILFVRNGKIYSINIQDKKFDITLIYDVLVNKENMNKFLENYTTKF